MSSATLGFRHTDDLYRTPRWAIDLLLNTVRPPFVSSFLEPCAGDGVILSVMDHTRCHRQVAYDINPRDELRRGIIMDDFLKREPPAIPYSLCITNPPYALAFDFARKLIEERWAHDIYLLLRVGFASSATRNAWLRKHPPSLYFLGNHPSFTPDGRTDSTDYAWFRWRTDSFERPSAVWLPSLTKAQRDAAP